MRQLNKQSIQSALTLPGFEQWRPKVDVPELHRPRQRPTDLPGEGRQAAVMMLLYPDVESKEQNLNIVLTRRHKQLTKHAGQISFPGGRQDEGESLQVTALRETSEEIGVSQAGIEVLGQLHTVYIPPSDFTVAPFVGWLDLKPGFVRAPAEVDEIIEVPLAHLLDPTTLVTGEVESAEGASLVVPYYRFQQHRIWGATAIMLGELIERVVRVVS